MIRAFNPLVSQVKPAASLSIRLFGSVSKMELTDPTQPLNENVCLVSPSWLQGNLNKNTVVLDGSWYMPAMKRDPDAEFISQRIPTSKRFNIDVVADKTTTLPHMLPTAAEFAKHMSDLGISHDTNVVIYDGLGMFSAARVWYTMKVFQHPRSVVLHGGFPRWKAEGFSVESGEVSSSSDGKGVPEESWDMKPEFVKSLDQVEALLGEHSLSASAGSKGKDALDLIVDARPAGRFTGEVPEPRPGLPSGHMPHAKSLPFLSLLQGPEKFNLYKPEGDLRAAFEEARVSLAHPSKIVATCGSGTSACIVLLAARVLGRPLEEMALYDGSWTEYASKPTSIIEKGPAM
jgi:thiosulfate/3-mercaptopyruvate sulfurtransferase